MPSFKVEVQTDSSGKWYSNAMRYHTKEQAELSGADLASRWMLVREWRVAEDAEEPNTDKPTIYGAGHRVKL